MVRMTRTIFLAILLSLSFAVVAEAQQPGFVPLADASQSPMLQGIYESGNFGSYVNAMFKVALSVGAILAVLRIAYAGYLYMASDMWNTKAKAREILGNVVLGLLLLLSIYLILYQINPDILRLNIFENIPTATKS